MISLRKFFSLDQIPGRADRVQGHVSIVVQKKLNTEPGNKRRVASEVLRDALFPKRK